MSLLTVPGATKTTRQTGLAPAHTATDRLSDNAAHEIVDIFHFSAVVHVFCPRPMCNVKMVSHCDEPTIITLPCIPLSHTELFNLFQLIFFGSICLNQPSSHSRQMEQLSGEPSGAFSK